MRQVILDTETTGLNPKQGHRVIEIGCVELLHRRLTGRHFHCYLNPDRAVDEGAFQVHGISDEFLQDKPRFADIVDEFITYIDGAELVIHNAPFDVGFLDSEFAKLKPKRGRIGDRCSIFDTLVEARKLFPGQKNNLDALCKRYDIRHFSRDLHGALLDSEILAQVYLAMTAGQAAMFADESAEASVNIDTASTHSQIVGAQLATPVIYANADEIALHEAYLQDIRES